jgi:hypothetical protein
MAQTEDAKFEQLADQLSVWLKERYQGSDRKAELNKLTREAIAGLGARLRQEKLIDDCPPGQHLCPDGINCCDDTL